MDTLHIIKLCPHVNHEVYNISTMNFFEFRRLSNGRLKTPKEVSRTGFITAMLQYFARQILCRQKLQTDQKVELYLFIKVTAKGSMTCANFSQFEA